MCLKLKIYIENIAVYRPQNKQKNVLNEEGFEY